MLRTLALLSTLSLLLLGAQAAGAQATNSAAASAALQALFSAPITRDTFSAAANPTPANIENVRQAVKGLVRALGPLTKIAAAGDGFSLVFSSGSAQAAIELDAQGKISSVNFLNAEGPALAAALKRLLTADKADPASFSDSFLQHVAPAQIDATLAQMHAQFGAFQSLDASPSGYVATFERGRLAVQIMFDGDGKIIVLQLHRA